MAVSQEIDAVYIATPNSYHAEQAILFLQNGKHVLCEKPLAVNATEVARMIQAAKDHNALLMVAMKSTLLPNFKVIQDNLHKIGSISRYFASYCQYSSRYDKFKEGIVIANSYLASELQGEKGSIMMDKIHTSEKVEIHYTDSTVKQLTVAQSHPGMYYEVKEFIELINRGSLILTHIKTHTPRYKCWIK